jgi:protein involved in polysaccharide export with SLBB domain
MRRVTPALLVLLLAACSSMQPLRVSDLEGNAAPAELRAGDRVEVVTVDREKFEFTVSEINTIGLGGKFGFIPYDRMRSLSVRRPGADARDLQWLWAVLGAAAVVAIIANADSVSVCSPGPCPSE